nr:HNH endonuclease signature motif containing protein [uncultured Roseateles sp.]
MTTVVLTISWERAEERVRVNLEALKDGVAALRTTEKWMDHRKTVTYEPRARYSKTRNGRHILNLTYLETDHPELRGKGVIWGASKISIAADLTSASVNWTSSPPDEHTDGQANCSISIEPDDRNEEREWVSRIKRRQQEFKATLVRCGATCEITKEPLTAVLEAAHIRDVNDGGQDIPENGILLRADLHTLFDAGYFSIERDGTLRLHPDLSASYRDLLANASISPAALKRIADHLAQRKPRDAASGTND